MTVSPLTETAIGTLKETVKREDWFSDRPDSDAIRAVEQNMLKNHPGADVISVTAERKEFEDEHGPYTKWRVVIHAVTERRGDPP